MHIYSLIEDDAVDIHPGDLIECLDGSVVMVLPRGIDSTSASMMRLLQIDGSVWTGLGHWFGARRVLCRASEMEL